MYVNAMRATVILLKLIQRYTCIAIVLSTICMQIAENNRYFVPGCKSTYKTETFKKRKRARTYPFDVGFRLKYIIELTGLNLLPQTFCDVYWGRPFILKCGYDCFHMKLKDVFQHQKRNAHGSRILT